MLSMEVCAEVNDGDKQNITDRDFVYLLRRLRAEATDRNRTTPQGDSLLRGLEVNFARPGVPLRKCVDIFFTSIRRELESNDLGTQFSVPTHLYRTPLAILHDAINGGCEDSGNRQASMRSNHPHLAPRFCMLVDCGKDDAVVRLLHEQGRLPRVVVHVPDIGVGAAADTHAVQSACKHSALHGDRAASVVAKRRWVLSPLYNLFNQNYIEIKRNGEKLRHVRVAYGARTELCRVHPDFYVVLHMPLADYDRQPAPLKSRFSAVQIFPTQV